MMNVGTLFFDVVFCFPCCVCCMFCMLCSLCILCLCYVYVCVCYV